MEAAISSPAISSVFPALPDCRPLPAFPARCTRRAAGAAGGGRLPEHVVDLGSGTGLSTRYWQDKAARVTGIEPSGNARSGRGRYHCPNVTYRAGFSHDTGLPGECARIVTCAQSLHWMDPNGTFPEVQRILVPGGVFAAFDYDWPPTTGSWQADLAFQDCLATVSRIEKGREQSGQRAAPRSSPGQKAAPRAHGAIRLLSLYQRDCPAPHQTGSAERLVGLAMSQGSLMNLLKQGLPETAFGLDSLRKTAARNAGRCFPRVGLELPGTVGD